MKSRGERLRSYESEEIRKRLRMKTMRRWYREGTGGDERYVKENHIEKSRVNMNITKENKVMGRKGRAEGTTRWERKGELSIRRRR